MIQGFWILSIHLNFSEYTWENISGLCLDFLAWLEGLWFRVISGCGQALLRRCRNRRKSDCWGLLGFFPLEIITITTLNSASLFSSPSLAPLLFLLIAENFESEIYLFYAAASPTHPSPMNNVLPVLLAFCAFPKPSLDSSWWFWKYLEGVFGQWQLLFIPDLVDQHNESSGGTHVTPASPGCSLFHRWVTQTPWIAPDHDATFSQASGSLNWCHWPPVSYLHVFQVLLVSVLGCLLKLL